MKNASSLVSKIDRVFNRLLLVLTPLLVASAFFFIGRHFEAPVWLSAMIAIVVGFGTLAEDAPLNWRRLGAVTVAKVKALRWSLNRGDVQRANASL